MNHSKKFAQTNIWYIIRIGWHLVEMENSHKFVIIVSWPLLFSAEGSSLCSRQWSLTSNIPGRLSSDKDREAVTKRPYPVSPETTFGCYGFWKRFQHLVIAYAYFHDTFVILTFISIFPSLRAIETIMTKPSMATLQNQGMSIKCSHSGFQRSHQMEEDTKSQRWKWAFFSSYLSVDLGSRSHFFFLTYLPARQCTLAPQTLQAK